MKLKINTKTIVAILFVIAWMGIIFYFSHQQGEGSGNTSRSVSTKIINFIHGNDQTTEEQRQQEALKLEPYVRKFAHLSIYMLGGILLLNAGNQIFLEEKKALIYSGLIGVVYAASDEIHQLFIIGRSGRFVDVVIDSLGLFIGIAIFLIILKMIQAIQNKVRKLKGVE